MRAWELKKKKKKPLCAREKELHRGKEKHQYFRPKCCWKKLREALRSCSSVTKPSVNVVKKIKLGNGRRRRMRCGAKEKKSTTSAVRFELKYQSGNLVFSSIAVLKSIVLCEGSVVWEKIHNLWWSEKICGWLESLFGRSKIVRGWWVENPCCIFFIIVMLVVLNLKTS